MKAFLTSVAALIIGIVALVASFGHGDAVLPKLGGAGAIDAVNYHCWSGYCHYYGSKSVSQATTTACAIQSPAATTTLSTFGVRVDTASSSATTWMTGTGSTQFATTSAIGGISTIGAAGTGFIQGSTSPAAGSNTVLGPNTWVIIKNNGGITSGDTTALGFVPAGTCFATFDGTNY